MKTLESQHDTEVLKRTGLQGENKQLMDQVAELNTKDKQLSKVSVGNHSSNPFLLRGGAKSSPKKGKKGGGDIF